jgi:hypothetical protein
MTMRKLWFPTAGAAVAVGVALLAIPKVFPICDEMLQTAGGGATPMHCYYTYQAEFWVCLVLLLVGIGMFFLRGAEARRVAGLSLIALAVVALQFPRSSVIGICHGSGHGCPRTTAWLTGALVIELLVGATALVTASPRRGAEPLEEGDVR